MRRFNLSALLGTVAIGVMACGDAITAPADPGALSHDITLGELGQALNTAPARVEVRLEAGTLVAREVELKTADEMADEESIRAPVTAISADDVSGMLTVGIGGLTITFASSARFRDDEGDLTFGDFVSRIETALTNGIQPGVRAKRPPPAEPQGPDDPAFEATELRLGNSGGSPKIELNVDSDNFRLNDAPPPEAWLLVLGLELEIHATTEIEADDDDRDEGEVHGLVTAVDPDAATITLQNGAVIVVPDQGAFDDDGGEDGDDEHLGSLDAVAQALEDGFEVKCEAEGAVQSTNPLTILAREVECEIRNGDDDDDDDDDDGVNQGSFVEFEGRVQSVDIDAREFLLASGATVKLAEATTVSAEGDLTTLQGVADALAANQIVEAEGKATVDSEGPPPVLTALTVKWETED